jgi:hypothetical protein
MPLFPQDLPDLAPVRKKEITMPAMESSRPNRTQRRNFRRDLATVQREDFYNGSVAMRGKDEPVSRPVVLGAVKYQCMQARLRARKPLTLG